LELLFLGPVAIDAKIFTPALAFIANQFAVFCNDIPFPVTACTNHFSLPVSTPRGVIKRVASTGLAYTLFVSGWQGKN
jgi:hypothetical protein